jgi:hypothetical protein
LHLVGQLLTRIKILHTYLPMKMKKKCSETSEYEIQTQGNYPEEPVQLYLFPYIFILYEESYTQRSKHVAVIYIQNVLQFLDTLAELRIATISFFMSVRPSARKTRLPLNGFSWNFVSEVFSKICRVNSSCSKIGQEWRVVYMNTDKFVIIYGSFLFRMKIISDKFVEKIKTKISCSVTVFFLSKIVLEVMRKSTVEADRLQMTIWRTCITCCISKSVHTHSQHVIFTVYSGNKQS